MLLAVEIGPLKQQSMIIVAIIARSGFDSERAADFDRWFRLRLVCETKDRRRSACNRVAE
jgi:hypothetical protein